MNDSERHIRIGFLLLAAAFAGLALYLQNDLDNSLAGHTVSGLYRSNLLDEEVSPGVLSAEALSAEFRSVVGAVVEVEDVAESPVLVRVTTVHDDEYALESAHERAIKLLSSKLKEAALTHVNSSLKYLQDVEAKTAELRRNFPVQEPPKVSAPEKRLSDTDSSRVLLLRKEISQLQAFLQGKELPRALRVKLDREALGSAEVRVQNQKRELSRLAQVFHPSSKAVQAQRESTERAQADLLSLEHHLAEIYLRSLKIELENLESKTVSFIEENTSRLRDGELLSPEDEVEFTEGSGWVFERADELRTEAKKITNSSSLRLDGKLTHSRREAPSYPWIALGWLASLASLLAALFRPSRQSRPGGREQPDSPQASGAKRERSAPRLEILGLQTHLPAGNLETPPEFQDRFETFFAEIWHEMEQSLGRVPKRILVLGDSPVETRLAFSIRLANTIGRKGNSVRLIDFDLKNKGLSERLGRHNLPGIGELLLFGGPVDEFFSSIAGTRIQFAPAGTTDAIKEEVDLERVESILNQAPDAVTVIDATSCSPLHLVVNMIDAVLYTAQQAGTARSEREQEILVAFRDAGLPVWGISVHNTQFFPLL